MKMGGPGSIIEADEAFIGGKDNNKHQRQRDELRKLRNAADTQGNTKLMGKTIVMGMLDRNQRKIRTAIVPVVNRIEIQSEILRNVARGSRIYTDESKVYAYLPKDFIHEFVNHAEKYVEGQVHTNGLENFWSLLKRNLRGTYVAVEPFHLGRYLDEQVYRFNHRKDEFGNKIPDLNRFAMALRKIAGKRLTYAELTGKEGGAET